MVKIYDRHKNEYYIEDQYGEKALHFLYNNPFGRILLKIAICKSFSRLEKRRMDSHKSIRLIEPFVLKNGINLDDFEKKEYISFNDFFTRKIKATARAICTDDMSIISPADSKLLVYEITDDLRLIIKHSTYNISSLLRDENLAKSFAGGLCLIYRLTVDDYHRYCFCENGKVIDSKRIDGVLHTVSSLSQKYDIYTENSREYNVIDNSYLGDVIQMEVGALLIGEINNHDLSYSQMGQEKGFFSYGGSTIIVLYPKEKVLIDEDILKQSRDGIETKVLYGEKIGRKL